MEESKLEGDSYGDNMNKSGKGELPLLQQVVMMVVTRGKN
jgi:hypothetical protein